MTGVGIGFIGNLPVRKVLEYAQTAERRGLDSIFVHETYFFRDAFTYLAPLATTTNRLRIGVGCVGPYTRHPVVLAMTMASLQELSAGRMILGLGTGYPGRLEQIGIIVRKPVHALRETIMMLRSLWRGETISYEGQSFQMRGVKPLFPTMQRVTPIYVAGWRPRVLKLAADLADGYLARGGESIASLTHILSEIRNAAGRSLHEFDVAAYVLCSLAADPREAREAARRDPFVLYMLSVAEPSLLEASGFPLDITRPIAEAYNRGDLQNAAECVSDDLLDAFLVADRPADAEARLEALVKIGVKSPILQPIRVTADDVARTLDLATAFVTTD